MKTPHTILIYALLVLTAIISLGLMSILVVAVATAASTVYEHLTQLSTDELVTGTLILLSTGGVFTFIYYIPTIINYSINKLKSND